jgi:hypothetical protein
MWARARANGAGCEEGLGRPGAGLSCRLVHWSWSMDRMLSLCLARSHTPFIALCVTVIGTTWTR